MKPLKAAMIIELETMVIEFDTPLIISVGCLFMCTIKKVICEISHITVLYSIHYFPIIRTKFNNGR